MEEFNILFSIVFFNLYKFSKILRVTQVHGFLEGKKVIEEALLLKREKKKEEKKKFAD